MGAFNVQRARDHGIPTYGKYRSIAGNKYPSSWEDVKGVFADETIYTLKELYDSPADIDLWIGLIAEIPEHDQLLGHTQRCKSP